MVSDRDLLAFMRAISDTDRPTTTRLLSASPELATARLVTDGTRTTDLIEVGADPEATAAGGVTPLLRAVRNRCSGAVRVLLDAGVDPHRTNDNGSSPLDLARLTTGRGGTGSPEAKAEQAQIIQMLESTRR